MCDATARAGVPAAQPLVWGTVTDMTARRLSVAHVDLDTFFVAVARRRDPSLAGRPVVVGSDHARGAVASASYEARHHGVRAGWSVQHAKQVCPQLVVVEVARDDVADASREVFEVVADAGFRFVKVSVDEAFLDLRGLGGDGQGDPRWAGVRAVARLRQTVVAETGLVMSVGVASAWVYAKMASAAAKPDGLEVVEAGGEAAWAAPFDVAAVPGVGPVAAQQLSTIGVRTVSQLAAADIEVLAAAVGARHARDWSAVASGDATEALPESRGAAKSLSVARTLPSDAYSLEDLDTHLEELAAQLAGRLQGFGFGAGTLQVTVRGPDRRDRSVRVDAGHSSEAAELAGHARRALDKLAVTGGVRLVGLAALRLRPGQQQSFSFEGPTGPAVGTGVGARVHHAVFGSGVVLGRDGGHLQVRFADRDRWVEAGRLDGGC